MHLTPLLLDVDGVLNAEVPSPDFDDWVYNEYVQSRAWQDAKILPLWTSKTMCKMLMALPVAITWLTDWGPLANQVISPLCGMPEFPVMLEGGAGWHPVRWWKRFYVDDHLDSHHQGSVLHRPRRAVGVRRRHPHQAADRALPSLHL